MAEAERASRAVLRQIEAGSSHLECAGCDERIIYRVRHKANRIICNVYVAGLWVAVEHWHEECYDGRYGEPDDTKVRGKNG
jgi:DNA-directed RNA polymerase subunit RPC12/RpoP